MRGSGSPRGFSTVFLVALLAPGSVEAEVGRLQSAVFRLRGLVSAVALPPLIPICFVPEKGGAELFKTMGGRSRSPRDFKTTVLAWENGGLFLCVESGGIWAGLRREATDAFGQDEDRGLFQAAEGFCLGCWEAAGPERAGIEVEVPDLRFSSCSLTLISMRIADAAQWWRDLRIEVVGKRPLR